MISHEEKLVNQWRRDHKILDLLITATVLFTLFGLIPMFFAVFYKLFGLTHTSFTAWLLGLSTTIACLLGLACYLKHKGILKDD